MSTYNADNMATVAQLHKFFEDFKNNFKNNPNAPIFSNYLNGAKDFLKFISECYKKETIVSYKEEQMYLEVQNGQQKQS